MNLSIIDYFLTFKVGFLNLIFFSTIFLFNVLDHVCGSLIVLFCEYFHLSRKEQHSEFLTKMLSPTSNAGTCVN